MEIEENQGEIVVYQAADGVTKVDVRFKGETVWLNKNQMSLLYGRDRTNIGRHIQNIFREGEMPQESNVQKMHVAFLTSQ